MFHDELIADEEHQTQATRQEGSDDGEITQEDAWTVRTCKPCLKGLNPQRFAGALGQGIDLKYLFI